PRPDQLWVLPSGRSGPRRVRVSWNYAEGDEGLDRPRLERPRLEGATGGPAHWTVWVPAGWRLREEGDGRAPLTGLARLADLDLAGARATLAASRGAADAPAEWSALQRDFYRDLRRAEWDVRSAGADPSAVTALAGEATRQAERLGHEALRARAER